MEVLKVTTVEEAVRILLPQTPEKARELLLRLSFGRKYYGGTGLVGKKRRPQFHVAVAIVATDIGSVEKAQKAAAKESRDNIFCCYSSR
uniref:Uncharacterized protein n=1 Tax=Salix viminalis TaxID=40686 RepID=A0A6N2N0J8_SALVM